MRKVIGVMPLYDAEKKSYWIQPALSADASKQKMQYPWCFL